MFFSAGEFWDVLWLILDGYLATTQRPALALFEGIAGYMNATVCSCFYVL